MVSRHQQRRAHSHRHQNSSSSEGSYNSEQSRSTAPTDYSVRPVLTHYDTGPAKFGAYVDRSFEQSADDPRASVETYASTVASAEDLAHQPEYQLPEGEYEIYPSDGIATTPQQFADLFPSSREYLIRHDDATSDGNMNLRVDTKVSTASGRRQKMTLFHLRMKDLRDRQFSLRRYCRDSGREICHSTRKYAKPAPKRPKPQKQQKRPALQRSLSSALQTLGLKAEIPTSQKQRDSAYGSMDEDDDNNFKGFLEHVSDISTVGATIPTTTIKIEFSNYAQVEVRRRRTRSSKQYEFEYWGASYFWQRESQRVGDSKEFSYHLTSSNCPSKSIAHITPLPLSPRESMDEEYKGGWVPPCSLVLTDRSTFGSDVADVIVATGLIALVDDCIKRRWHSKGSVHLGIPARNTAEHVGPKQLIDEVFNRRGYTENQRPTPTRQISNYR